MKTPNQLTIYRNCLPVVDARYDEGSDRTVTDALVGAIAEAKSVAPSDVEPLYDSIDLEALSQLFEKHDGATDAGTVLGFTFENWNVFVHADGRIRVCDGTHVGEPEPVFEE